MTYKVDRIPAVNQEMRALAQRAKARRIHDSYGDALRQMLARLQDDPLEWGDPENNTQHPGGITCHGIVWPVLVRFNVYQAEQIVMIIDITPLPKTPLADS
jgi:hypothetical protein